MDNVGKVPFGINADMRQTGFAINLQFGAIENLDNRGIDPSFQPRPKHGDKLTIDRAPSTRRSPSSPDRLIGGAGRALGHDCEDAPQFGVGD